MAVRELLNAPVKVLAGVGPAKAAAYAKMGVETLGDLIHRYPRAYENRGDIKLLSEAALTGGKCAVVLTIGTEVKVTNIRRGMTLVKFRAYDDSGTAEITFFNQAFLKDKFPLGSTFRFYGKVDIVGRRYAMSSPTSEYYDELDPPRDLVSVYRMTEGINGKQIAKDVETAFSLCRDELTDPMPEEIIEKYRLCPLKTALRNIHFPEDYRLLASAKRRLVFDEFFNFALGLALTKQKEREHGAPVFKNLDLSEFVKCLPYELTADQKKAINDMASDMKKDVPMNRMIVGDVGCGKTVCAAAAMYLAVKNGKQTALMAPTEILARQHFADISELFGRLGVECALLIGATTAAQKRKIKERLASGEISVVIGTQALLSDGVEFADAGLIVTDEQHRFGVNQRATLAGKSGKAHLLVMSATPIPRSMALISYGDLDVSRIISMPPGRQRVDTFAVDESYRPRLEAFIEKQVALGGQVYIVCPAVEEGEEIDAGEISLDDISMADGVVKFDKREELPPLKAAVEYSAELARRFPDLIVDFLHGKMSPAQKERVMKDFADGVTNILVSTTVIEVGVNVPNACLMIVENADRFGLSQLHQLRGRVGRGTRKSYCVLVSAFSSGQLAETNAGKRLKSLCNLYDGYAIAEQDLLMRGPGDFFKMGSDDSIRQSGGIKLNLAEQCEDASLMTSAFSEAAALVSADPRLENHKGLLKSVKKMFLAEARTMN